MSTLFSPQRIAAAMRCATPGLSIETVESTGSTNADLMAQVGQMVAPVVLVADQQLGGRGRAGRRWHSQAESSLTFSLAWRFYSSVQALSGLSLVVGIALADALAACGEEIQLKWPNDLLRDQKKLGGVLIETSADPRADGALWAIIGIGLNLQQSDRLQTEVGQPVSALSATTVSDRDALLARLLDHLCTHLTQFEREGFVNFAPRWNALHAHRDLPVRIVDRGQLLHAGVARGVDAQGCLLLETPSGLHAVVAGDVSLRTVDI